MEKKNLIILFIAFILIGLLIVFMPQIYNKMQEYDTPKVEKPKNVSKAENEELEEITMDSDVVLNLTYPIMRNDKYSLDSYYQLSKFSVNDLSNNDILSIAFLDMYEGYLVNHESVGCANNSKEFASSYLSSRIKNVIGRDIDYTNEDFTVPNIDNDTEYTGMWKYSATTDSYIYYGDCNEKNSNTIYYDLNTLEKLEAVNENNVLYLYHKVGFAKIINNGFDYSYTIYSDTNMENEIDSGKIDNIDDINNIYKNLDKESFNTYKFTFKKGLCTYDNYCFYKGEWIND